METSREYYNRVMASYKANRGRRSLRKYCQDEGIDYHWLVKSMKEFADSEPRDEDPGQQAGTAEHFIPLEIEQEEKHDGNNGTNEWNVKELVLAGPFGDVSVKTESLTSLLELLKRLI